MSVSVFGITGKSVKAVLLGEKIELRLGRFVCMNNDFFGSEKIDGLIRRAESNYRRSRRADYFVDDVSGDASDLDGSVVFKVPEGYCGVHRDYETDNFEVVGTLFESQNEKGKRTFKIETDLNTIEQIRREREFARMAEGHLSIGAYGNDASAYKEALQEKDAEAPEGMFTRGHGLW